VHSRALLSHSPGGLNDEFDFAFLEQIDGFTATQSIVRLGQEIQDGPRVIGRQGLANGLETLDDGAVRVELKGWIASVVARAGNSKEAAFLDALVNGLTRDAPNERSDLV
jgi:hypothetical protein